MWCAVAAFMAGISPVLAQTNSMAGNNDWTNSAAWSLGHRPTGPETAEIQAGVTADAYRCAETNNYTGNLILRAGAQLLIDDYGGNDFRDFLPSDTGSAIYLYNGSRLQVKSGDNTVMDHPIVVDGAVILDKGSAFNAGDWLINGVISGTGSVTYELSTGTHDNREIFLSPPSPCTYTGGATINNVSGKNQYVVVFANGAFGTGDVTIKTDSRVVLNSGSTSDVIDDSSSLYIEGTGILNLNNNNETVNQLFIDAVPYPAGAYNSGNVGFLLGSGTLTVSSPSDTNAPAFGSFTNDVAGGPVSETDHVINYTVSFTDDFSLINGTTVTASDFTNAGTATISFGPIAQLSGTNFNVIVYIHSAGTIQLQIPAGADIRDMGGNALDTSSAITDATIITVTPFSPPGDGARMEPVFNGSTNAIVVSGQTNLYFDASASDKLVVAITGEHGFVGNLSGDCTAITYDGTPLTKAVDRNPIGSAPSASIDQNFNDIWYLDDPASVHVEGAIVVTISGHAVATAFGLSNTAPGSGGTAVSAQELKYARLGAEYSKSIVIASHGMGGDGNTADTQNVNTAPPLVETSALKEGSSWSGHVTGYMPVLSQGVVIPTFTGGNTVGCNTIAAEFPGIPSPGLLLIIR